MSSERAALVLWLAVGACAPAPNGVLSGRASFEGEQDHSGIVVSVSGPSHAGTVTDRDGRFSVGALAPGTYSVIFAASDAVDPTQSRIALAGTEVSGVVFRPTGRVTGTVIDAATLEPLPGALILSTGGAAAATSAADGSFTLAGIQTGEATVVVSFTGLAAQQKRVQVRRGVPLKLGTIALGPASTEQGPAAISGQVVFADGTPAPAATVHIKGVQVDRQIQTGADGKFRFDKLRAGVVSLEASTAAWGARLPSVLAIEGTSGMIISGGLYPLASNPIELTRGRHLTDLTSGTMTPDGKMLIGVSQTTVGRNVRAVPINGDPPIEILKDDEVGLSTPTVAAIGTDSTTLAISLSDPSGSDSGRQLFLASTLSEGRQLISDRACPLGSSGDSFFFVLGANCRFGGQLVATPLKFGAPPTMLGTLASSYLADLQHLQLLDLVPRPAPALTFDVDLLSVGPQPSRKRVASNIARVFRQSPDGKYLSYYQTYGGYPESGSFDVVSLTTGAALHLLDRAVVSTQTFTSTGKLVVGAYLGPVSAFDLQTGARTDLGDQVTSFAVAPDGSSAFLFRKRSDSELGALTRVPLAGGTEAPVAEAVAWYQQSPDGQWLYFIDEVDLATRRGRLMRVASSGGTPQRVDPDASANSSQLPVFSKHGEFVAWVRRAGELFAAVSFDAVKAVATVLAPLEEPTTWRWKFSPGARYLSYDSLAGTPNVINVQATGGGPRQAVSSESDLLWLTDRSALIFRYSARPWTGAGGTYHATFE